MARQRGRFVPLSLPRRWLGDLGWLSRKVECVGIKRRIDVSRAAAARAALASRPRWSAIMAKAYGLVALERPELRRTYMPWPTPHFYEHPRSVATVVVHRVLDDGEPGVFFSQIGQPEAMSLAVLDAEIRRLKAAPIATIGGFRRLLRTARYPRFVRRALAAATFYASGDAKARYFGTFAVNSLIDPDTEPVAIFVPITLVLYYSAVDADGRMTVHIYFDHRVIDGIPLIQALDALAAALNGPVADELEAMARDQPRPAASPLRRAGHHND
jgi:hypothetical protein